MNASTEHSRAEQVHHRDKGTTATGQARQSRLPRALRVGMASIGAALVLAGCGLFGGASTAPTAVPTRTPLPTFTPTVAAVQEVATPTTAPVDAAAPTAA